MPTARAELRFRLILAGMLVVLQAAMLGAGAQVFETRPCATQPEGETDNVRAVAGACGTAAFQIDPQQRRLGAVRLAVGGSLYVRALRLTYQSSGGGAQQQTQIPLHRLLVEGETTDPIPTTRSGLALVAVAVDINPPGYGVGPIAMALIGAEGSQREAAADAGEHTGRVTGDGWILIGSTSARLAEARDTIVIGRAKGRFDGLAIGSRGNDLPVQSVIVSPASGAPFSVDVRRVIAPGTSGLAIAIEPPDFVHEVTVTYGTAAPSSRAALLEVRGHYAENWLGRVGDNRHYAGGWVMLGTADIVAVPHKPAAGDRLRIAGQPGPFKKLRFVARRGAVSLGNVAIDVGDGRHETVPVNALLMPDVQSAPVTLQSGAVPIESLVLSPQLRASSRIDVTVEVWAQY